MKPVTQKKIDEVVGQALGLAAKAHVWHLSTDNYAAHLAYGELYNLAHDIADGISEPCQGEGYDQGVPSVTVSFTHVDRAVTETEEFCGSSGLGKLLLAVQGAKEYDWLTNIVQGFQGDLYSILYKLKKLS
jgi:hypothetical protein